MFVHFINEKPVAISEYNLFSEGNSKYSDFRKLLENKGFTWLDNFTVKSENNVWEFTVNQTKLFTTHENFDNQFYDLIYWLSGVDNRRDITKNFK